MDKRPDLDTQIKLHKRTGLAQSTIQRVLTRQVHTALDVVQALADAFGVPPLSLLEPLQPGETVVVAPTIEEITLLQQWRQLDTLEKHTVIGYIGLVVTRKQQPAETVDRHAGLNTKLNVPPDLAAAVTRASANPIPKTKGNQGNDQKPIESTRGKRKAAK